MNILFNYLIFPGFIFTAVAGLFASYVDRKVTARVQWRKGPPLLQPLHDFVKLLGKETMVPVGSSKTTFLLAPVFALTSIVIVSTIVWNTLLSPGKTFLGDLIVTVYLLTIPSIMIILSGFASKNPLASIGASREMKLILSYELPYLFAILVPIIKSNSIRLGEIVQYQWTEGPFIGSVSGIIAVIVMVLCTQAKLGLVPFDMAEAEQEIIAGPFIEYSGPPLGIFKLTKWSMLFVVPSLTVLLFFPALNFWGNILGYVILLVVVVLIRNTNPRVRIDQAVRFFWTWVTLLSLISVVLASYGL